LEGQLKHDRVKALLFRLDNALHAKFDEGLDGLSQQRRVDSSQLAA
jgi:ABC-type transporter Mla MlaB component